MSTSHRPCHRPHQRSLLLLAVLIPFVALVAPSPASAQDGDGGAPSAGGARSGVPVTWSVRPVAGEDGSARPNFVLDAEPGATVTDELVVTNDGAVNLVLGVYVSDAFNTAEGETDLLAGDERPRDIGAWTTTGTSSITVPAGGQVTVPFTVAVPEDAPAGDHVGGIVTSLTVTEEGTGGTRVKVERRLGSRIYLRVAGELRPELTFTELSAEYHGSINPFSPGTTELTYTVENTGNVRLRATRIARVATSLGFAERADEAADMSELLPDNSFTFTQRVGGVWPGFSTTSSIELDPYDASGEQLRPPAAPAIARTSTTLVPWSAVVLLVLVALGVVVGMLLRRRKRRRDRQQLSSQIDAAVAKAVGHRPAGTDGGPPGAFDGRQPDHQVPAEPNP